MPVALVLGASRGLGMLVSEQLLRRGHTVHGCARDASELEAAGRDLTATVPPTEGKHPRFVPHVCDVRDAEAVSALVGEVVDAEAGLDVAIHVAGVIQVGHADAMTLGHYRDAVDTMLWGPVHLCLAAVPVMQRAGRGRIGVVSSVGGLLGVPRLVPYSVAKFGAVGLAEGLHAELAGSGVTVTAVTPGLMRTGGHVHARFVDDPPADYAWFAPAASLPLLSISAPRAAHRIVEGVLAGRPTVELTPLTVVARRVHGLAPATTIRALGLVSRLLPGPARSAPDPGSLARPSVEGRRARAALGSRVVDALSVLGNRAAHHHNELGAALVSDPDAGR